MTYYAEFLKEGFFVRTIIEISSADLLNGTQHNNHLSISTLYPVLQFLRFVTLVVSTGCADKRGTIPPFLFFAIWTHALLNVHR